MGSHDPFEYFKHKLWPKKRAKIKLSIWLSTTKSQEWPWFTCMQVLCHIPLESFQQGLQLCFRPQLNRRSAQRVMDFQSHGNPNFWNYGTPNLGVPRQNDIWVQGMWPSTKNIIRGEGGGFSQVQAIVSLMSPCLPMARLCTKNAPTTH
jgi:hypothetical protein